jgi:hypothetical protein
LKLPLFDHLNYLHTMKFVEFLMISLSQQQ